jgi:hypothetical protein
MKPVPGIAVVSIKTLQLPVKVGFYLQPLVVIKARFAPVNIIACFKPGKRHFYFLRKTAKSGNEQ